MKHWIKKYLVGEISWRRLATALMFIYAGVGIGGWFISDRLIFVPQPVSYADSAAILKVPVVGGGTISARYLANHKADYTILYSHGNAEDLGDIEPSLILLHSAGFAVFAYDYRGYGTSGGGRPTTMKACQDAEAAYDYLVNVLRIPPEKIIIYGRSVGGGFATRLAARHPVAGLVLESPFVSTFRVMTHWPLYPFDKLRNLREVRNVKCPVLVMHGIEDRVIPFWHGQTMYAAVPGLKQCLWIKGAGHNDLAEVAGPRYTEALRGFAAGLHAGAGGR